jgi:7,8-dihydropterin-6-yl-methyl-4-(beta-D-ribofuranosyl)aminobenzene 5'-phosphate synthase
MPEPITITVLVENSVQSRGLLAEHGLACHLQVGKHSLLFDTGQSDLLLRNAHALQVRLEEIEAIVLSHGHNDHTGGLEAVRAAAQNAKLFLHPAALGPKFTRNPDGSSRPLGMDGASSITFHNADERVVWTTKPTEVLDGIFVTGEIPRQNDFEDTGGPFFLDPGCAQLDPLRDDQALFFDTPKGLVVLLGCAHAGVVNTLAYVRQFTGGRPVHTLLGGLHLLAASAGRMEKTLSALRDWDIREFVLGHCTGMAALARLWTAFPQRCSSCATGGRLVFRR